MKKIYSEPEFLKLKFELTEDIANGLSFGSELGDSDEWNTEDGDGDTIE